MFKDFFQGKKVVLFDLDGTLIESHPIWNAACAEVYSNLGREWRGLNFVTAPSVEDIWRSYLDFTREEVGVPISTLVTQTKDKFLTKMHDISQQEALIPGFWSFVNELKNEREMRLGLVTNTDRDVTEKVLAHLNISSVFEVTVCGDDVKNRKPDSAVYTKALKEFGIKGKEALCLEDSPAGVKSAISAGIQVIGVRNRIYSERDYPQDLIFIEDFTVFYGNLDKTRREVLEEEMASLSEEAES